MFNVILARSFEKDAKPLLKKYPSLRKELDDLGRILSENPKIGSPLGKDCYKIRVGIKSKGKGKSGGARVITYVITDNKEVVLIAIYDKQVKEDLDPNELQQLLDRL